MVQYDPKVIHEFAERLYAQAKWAILAYVVKGVLIGGVAGFAIGFALNRVQWGSPGPAAIILAALAGLIGYSLGREKTFQLRLQAQTALCQAKIEENTRK